jgi:hypothetical protein
MSFGLRRANSFTAIIPSSHMTLGCMHTNLAGTEGQVSIRAHFVGIDWGIYCSKHTSGSIRTAQEIQMCSSTQALL